MRYLTVMRFDRLFFAKREGRGRKRKKLVQTNILQCFQLYISQNFHENNYVEVIRGYIDLEV